jgi:metal-dependent amidase/aminoacylase/carboxypeptidase family protein
LVSISEEKKSALEFVDENRQWVSDFNKEIWGYAEPAFREYRSAKAYVKLLREEGFEVEEGSGEMRAQLLKKPTIELYVNLIFSVCYNIGLV